MKDTLFCQKRYTIAYSSPYYYLYEETHNKLILKSRSEKEVENLKSELEKIK